MSAEYAFSTRTRVGFSDTDAQAVVYYGRYLPYFDLARTKYHRHLGAIDIRGQFAMRASTVEYHAPARFDDLLEIFVRTSRIGRSSLTNECAAYRVEDDRLMCTARLTVVLIDTASRLPIDVPDDYRRSVAAFEGDCLE